MFLIECKFMVILVKLLLIGKKVLYIKGVFEIVFGKCKEVIFDGCCVDSVEYCLIVEV